MNHLKNKQQKLKFKKSRRRQHGLLRDFFNRTNIRLEHQVELDKRNNLTFAKDFLGNSVILIEK